MRKKSHIQLKLSRILYVRKNLVVFALSKTLKPISQTSIGQMMKTSFIYFLHFSFPSLYQSLSLKILLNQIVTFITKVEFEFYFLKNSTAKEDYLLSSNHCSARSMKTSRILIKLKRLIRNLVILRDDYPCDYGLVITWRIVFSEVKTCLNLTFNVSLFLIKRRWNFIHLCAFAQVFPSTRCTSFSLHQGNRNSFYKVGSDTISQGAIPDPQG